MKIRTLVTLAAGCALIAAGLPAEAYKPPAGPNSLTAYAEGDPKYDPHTHGWIVLKAIDVLQGDGQAAMADFFRRHKQQLLNGVRQADTANAFPLPFEIPILGREVPLNVFSHFYNPVTGRGFVLHLDEFAIIKTALTPITSLLAYQLNTLKGPFPASRDMCDWAYGQAVDAMRRGDTNRAVTLLGWALHYVGDGTVPQHATDEGLQKPGSNHGPYESACDDFIAQGKIPHATNGGFYNDALRPGQFVEEACRRSSTLIPLAKQPATFEQSARQMIPAAEQLTAGLMARFYRRWLEEDFTVVVLTIDRVKGILIKIKNPIPGLPDIPHPTANIDVNEADFYADVTVDGRSYRTGVVDGEDDMRPNSLVPYTWVFPKWIPGPFRAVPVRIGITDKDLGSPDDVIDISQTGLRKSLELNYNTANGAVSGDLNTTPSAGKTTVASTGGDAQKIAQIMLTLERFPSAPSVKILYTRLEPGPIKVTARRPLKPGPTGLSIISGPQAEGTVTFTVRATQSPLPLTIKKPGIIAVRPGLGAPSTGSLARIDPIGPPPIDAEVRIGGQVVGRTNSPITHTFRVAQDSNGVWLKPEIKVVKPGYREEIVAYELEVVQPPVLQAIPTRPRPLRL